MKIRVYLFSLFCILTISGCGVLLEPSKLIGVWKLESTEFYIYNRELDSYKTINSTDSTNDSKDSIYKGRFFLNTLNNYTIEFKDKGSDENAKSQFEVKNGAGLFVSQTDTEWVMDMFENSLSLEVFGEDTTSDNIWLKGFKIKNYWPLSKNNDKDVLEIFIDTKDINRDHFRFDLW